MGILETSSEVYYSTFKIGFIIAFFVVLINNVINFVDLSEFLLIDYDTSSLNTAINTVANAKGLDIIVALPSLLINIGTLMITSLINGINVIRKGIEIFINYIIFLVGIDLQIANILSSIISWLIITPAIIGLVVEIGRLIFYIMFGIRR